MQSLGNITSGTNIEGVVSAFEHVDDKELSVHVQIPTHLMPVKRTATIFHGP